MRFVKCIKGGFIMAKVRKICNTGSNKKIIIVKTVKSQNKNQKKVISLAQEIQEYKHQQEVNQSQKKYFQT